MTCISHDTEYLVPLLIRSLISVDISTNIHQFEFRFIQLKYSIGDIELVL